MADTQVTTVLDERAGGRRARVIIDNRAKANSLGWEAVEGLRRAFLALAADADLRVAVLAAAGDGAFIAGADLGVLGGADADGAQAYIMALQQAIQAIRDLPVPVIARINGACIGAGLEVAAACDIRVAAETAVFAMPEVSLDIPSVIEAALFPRLIGWGRTAWLLYRGDGIDAATAREWGLVERVAPAAELDAAVDEVAETILANGPVGIRLQKALMREWERLPLDDAVRAGIGSLTEAYRTGDPGGRIAALLARRKEEG